MQKIIKSVGAGVASLALVAISAGTASADVSGHYFSGADRLQCTDFVTDDGNGGSLSVRVFSGEERADTEHFRGAYVTTRLIAQEKTYNGTWKPVKWGSWHVGYPVVADVEDGTAVSYFRYNGAANPRFSITVAGQDDVFRVVVRSKVYSDEDALLASLRDVRGNCHL